METLDKRAKFYVGNDGNAMYGKRNNLNKIDWRRNTGIPGVPGRNNIDSIDVSITDFEKIIPVSQGGLSPNEFYKGDEVNEGWWGLGASTTTDTADLMSAPWVRNHWNHPFPSTIDVPDTVPPIVKKVTITQDGRTRYWGGWDEKKEKIGPNGVEVVVSRTWQEISEKKPCNGESQIKIRIEFSEKMWIEVDKKPDIKVTFGKDAPYTAYQFNGDWKDHQTWEGSCNPPKEESDGENTIRIETQDKDKNLLDGNPKTVVAIIGGERKYYEDENGTDNNKGGADQNHSFLLDPSPPKITKVEILQGEKNSQGNIINLKTRYSKDYISGNITSNPLVIGTLTSLFFKITFDEPLDTEKPLNVFFTSSSHPISFLSWSNTNTAWWGEFVIPTNQEYQGTHTLSISDATDLAGNTFDSDPDTEQPDPDTTNQFYIMIPDLAYISLVPDHQGDICLLNIEKKESINITNDTELQIYIGFFPKGNDISFHRALGDFFDIFKIKLDGTNITNLTNSPFFEDEAGELFSPEEWDGNRNVTPDEKTMFFCSSTKPVPHLDPGVDIWSLDLKGGTKTNLTNTPSSIEFFHDISPDGKRVIYYQQDYEGSDINKFLKESIWIMDIEGGNKKKLIEGNITKDIYPAYFRTIRFSPTGEIFFTAIIKEIEDGKPHFYYEIYSISQDGSNLRKLTETKDGRPKFITDINDKELLFSARDYLGGGIYDYDLYMMNQDGTGITGLITGAQSDAYAGRFLEDGRIAFISNKDGKDRLYVMNPEGTNIERLTNNPYSEKEVVLRKKEELKLGNISGYLKGSNIEGGIVNLLKDEIVVRTAMTDNNGYFIIENIPLGIYRLKALKKGYKTGFYQEDIIIEENKTTTIELKLAYIGEQGGLFAIAKDDGIYFQNADGSIQRKIFEGEISNLETSFDGKLLVYSSNQEIFILDLSSKITTQLTNNTNNDDHPSFSPDGRIVFSRDNYIWTMNQDGSDQKQVAKGDYPSFSPDGTRIVFSRLGSDYEIFLMNKDGTNIRQLTSNDIDDIEPTFSPDGETIAYNSNNTIYTMKLDGSNKTKITEGTKPKFSPDGKSLAFIFNNDLYTIDLQTQGLKKIAEGVKAISWSCGGVENKPPIPVITGRLTGYEGMPISLDGSSSYDLDGTITTYIWEIDG
ncbi:MAG: DUF5050 domain-containing protein, partial [bacterium]